MLPATLIALHMQKPLASVKTYVDERTMSSGQRLSELPQFSHQDEDFTVLIVDDTVFRGRQLTKTRGYIEATGEIKNTLLYAAPYIAPGADGYTDFYYEEIELPRVFEWNVLHHGALHDACVDIDGVLCRDPLPHENEEGEAYRHFLTSVEPLFLPRQRIGCLVTNRPEKYRALTEDWLHRHGISYDDLIMMDYASKEACQEANRYAEHKAKAYIATGAELFVESSDHQARDIAAIAGKPVYCVDSRQMFYPNNVSELYGAARRRRYRMGEMARKAWESPSKVPGKLIQKVRQRLPGLGAAAG
jgi:orotate phosphoribosyltransferase